LSTRHDITEKLLSWHYFKQRSLTHSISCQ